jgi:hypothetical protein
VSLALLAVFTASLADARLTSAAACSLHSPTSPHAVICPGSALVVHAALPRVLGAADAADGDDDAVGAMTFILSTADPSSETLGAS